MAAFATWVLYAREILGLTETQFGLLLTTGALGGLMDALTHLVLTAAPGAVTVLSRWLCSACTLSSWAPVATTVRQCAVPDALLGRVTNVYLVASVGGVGALAILNWRRLGHVKGQRGHT